MLKFESFVLNFFLTYKIHFHGLELYNMTYLLTKNMNLINPDLILSNDSKFINLLFKINFGNDNGLSTK